MSKKTIQLIVIFFLSISLVIIGNTTYASAEVNDDRIADGVYIDEVDVSQMTKDEAAIAVDNFIQNLQHKEIIITVGEKSARTTLGDMGYSYNLNDSLDEAYAIGRVGNLIKRYKEIKDIEQANKVFPLEFTMDDAKLKEFIAKEIGAFNIEPVNASLKRKNGQFVYTDHIVGSKVNVDLTSDTIMNIILYNWDRTDINVQAFMEEDMPKYTRKDVEKVNSILGSFSTEYKSSAEGRAANLANGAKLINNAVIYPDEVFSGYEYLTPFTPANGYYSAGAYAGGKVIDSIGGGACQVTTTLYNAVLFAELEVVERAAHSMTISYADLGRDAAIAGTYKDLKFMNSTDYPILIEAYTKGRRITFNIWGYDERSNNRKIKFETIVKSETKPPADVVTEDPTQPTTYRKVTQSAHTGYKAELYKIVYEDGVEVSRTLVNKSTYMPAPRYVTIGTMEVEKEPEEEPIKKPKDENTEPTQEDDIIDNSEKQDEQLEQDLYWDPSWEDEGYEDE
ncbi:MAG TPA: hypothetical protein GXZ21_04415 [Clostridiales bacterium]|nr:hypothetical protein [Clostridiales bacterium]